MYYNGIIEKADGFEEVKNYMYIIDNIDIGDSIINMFQIYSKRSYKK